MIPALREGPFPGGLQGLKEGLPQLLDYGGQLGGRIGEGAALQKRCPLRLLGTVGGELICRSGWRAGWDGGASALECRFQGLRQQCPVETELLRYHPEIVEVLHPADGHIERYKRLKLFGNDSLTGVCVHMGSGQVEQSGIVDLDRLRRDGIPEAHIDLKVQPGVAESGRKLDPFARIVLSLADFGGTDVAAIERQTVRLDLGLYDLSKCRGQCFVGRVADSEKIKITRRPVRLTAPGAKKHGPFQDEPVVMRRAPKAIQESLQSIADQDEVWIFLPLFGLVQQPLMDRLGETTGGLRHHDKTSMYGRITLATRHILAYCQSSVRVHLPFCRQSLSASTAISRPILFRYLKQSATVFAGL